MRDTRPECARLLRRAIVRALVCAGVALGPTKAVAQRAAADSAVAPARRRAPFAMFSQSAQQIRDSLVAMARAQIGARYVLGGESPDGGFDCSGLVRYLMTAMQVTLPRTAAQQATAGIAVEKDLTSLRPGDLLTFGKGARASHIGIYVGDGRFVHASSAAGRVVESNVLRPRSRLIKPWRGVRRLVIPVDSTAAGSTG
ncbi:MAG: C40 family peptidase [Gemmatimonadaceae bacterium]